MTDSDLLFDFLHSRLNEWWNVVDISRILKPDCVNWAVRSRRSNLNERFKNKREPYYIERRRGKNGCADYRMVIVGVGPIPIPLKLAPIHFETEENGQMRMVV